MNPLFTLKMTRAGRENRSLIKPELAVRRLFVVAVAPGESRRPPVWHAVSEYENRLRRLVVLEPDEVQAMADYVGRDWYSIE